MWETSHEKLACVIKNGLQVFSLKYQRWISRRQTNLVLFFSWLVSGRHSLNPAIWLVPGAGGNFRSCPLTERFRPASSLCDKIELPYSKKKINKLFTGFGSVRIVKNCDLRLEHFQDLGHSFSRYGPPSQ